MPLILGAQSASAGAFTVDNSCMFNGVDTYLSRTSSAAAPTNAYKATCSFWVKQCDPVPASQRYMFYTNGASSPYVQIQCPDSNGKLMIQDYISGGSTTDLVTTQVLRDPGAWMHVVYSYDSTPATPSVSSIKVFINGAQVTDFTTETYPSQNTATKLTAASQAYPIGVHAGTSAQWFDAYLAEYMVVDGQALDATDFGEFNEDSPTIWQPKDISGITLGAQGFYLNFADSTDLGKDAGANGFDWTSNNITALNQMTDTPTNNFPTMNPLVSYYSSSTLSEGNLKVAWNSDGGAQMLGNVGLTAGKWYWEWFMTDMADDYLRIGVTDAVPTADPAYLGAYTNDNYCNGSYGNYSYQGSWYNDDDGGTAYGIAWQSGAADGKPMSIGLDLDNNKIYIALDGTWMNSADPGGGTGGFSITAVSSLSGGQYFPALSLSSSNAYITETNFGNPTFTVASSNADANGYGSFEHAVPSGFLAICTKNLGSDGG